MPLRHRCVSQNNSNKKKLPPKLIFIYHWQVHRAPNGLITSLIQVQRWNVEKKRKDLGSWIPRATSLISSTTHQLLDWINVRLSLRLLRLITSLRPIISNSLLKIVGEMWDPSYYNISGNTATWEQLLLLLLPPPVNWHPTTSQGFNGNRNVQEAIRTTNMP